VRQARVDALNGNRMFELRNSAERIEKNFAPLKYWCPSPVNLSPLASQTAKVFSSSSGSEPELSDDLKDAANGDIELLRDRPTSQSLRSQPGDAVTMCVQRCGTSESYTFLLRRSQSCIDSLTNNLTLKLCHRAQNVKLLLTSRITFRGVYALRGHDECHLMRIEFIDQLRKERKAAPEPI
jgi:hypothetical protein